MSHVKLIVYSEELARSGLSGHINNLANNTQIRPKTTVSVCRGKAEDFFKEITPILEVSPARYYDLILSSFNYTSETANTELINFYTATQSIEREAFTILLKTTKNGDEKGSSNVSFDGLAVFKGNKMVGEIVPSLVRGHLLVSGGLQDLTITLPDVQDTEKTLTVNIKQSKSPKFDVKIEKNIPKIKIDVYINARLRSVSSTTDYLESENKYALNEEIKENIKLAVLDYLNKIKELDSDIAALGRFAKKNVLTHKEFEELDWPSIFKNSEFEINVHSELNVYQIIFHKIPQKE